MEPNGDARKVRAKGSYTRGYLMHHDNPGWTVGITFRLADSVPARLLRAYSALIGDLNVPPGALQRVRNHLEAYLAKGKGSRVLGDPRAATIVEETLRAGEPSEYSLIAWVVMPNHVHVLIRRTMRSSLAQIVMRWKGASARRINVLLGRRGPFWFRDYYDRDVQVEDDLSEVIRYVEMNPVKAGLCRQPTDWQFSSARVFPERWGG